MKIKIEYYNKKLELNVRKVGRLERGLGLTFRSKNTDNLLFEFGKDVRISITSFFVFFPFLILWLDDKNRVMGFNIVKPFTLTVKPKFNFRKFAELPINNANKEFIQLFVGRKV